MDYSHHDQEEELSETSESEDEEEEEEIFENLRNEILPKSEPEATKVATSEPETTNIVTEALIEKFSSDSEKSEAEEETESNIPVNSGIDFLSELSSKIGPKTVKKIEEKPKNTPIFENSESDEEPDSEKPGKGTKSGQNEPKVAEIVPKQVEKVPKIVKKEEPKKAEKSIFDSDSDSDDLFSGKPAKKEPILDKSEPKMDEKAAEEPKKLILEDSDDEEDSKPAKKSNFLSELSTKIGQKKSMLLFEDSSEDEMDSLFASKKPTKTNKSFLDICTETERNRTFKNKI